MSYEALALKYRPRTFKEIRGQEEITATLRRSIGEGRIYPAYLLSGPRGVGKTSTARILTRSLNCAKGPVEEPCNKCETCLEILNGSSLDFFEIDGASNRGIEEVRTINENTRFLPVKSRYKVYLIDEVHMLTDQAFNALLKTLEEPPEHVRFIFATTHPDKLPGTVISRCQRYDFHLIPGPVLVEHLKEIAGRESIDIEPAALVRISQAASGSFRDGIAVLDQLVSFRYGQKITAVDVEKLLSLVPEEEYLDVFQALVTGDGRRCLEKVAGLSRAGYDLYKFTSGLMGFIRHLLLLKAGAGDLIQDVVTPETERVLIDWAGRVDIETLLALLEGLADEREKLRFEDLVRVRLEVSLLKLAARAGGPAPVSASGGLPEPAPRPVARPETVSPAPEAVKPRPPEPPKAARAVSPAAPVPAPAAPPPAETAAPPDPGFNGAIQAAGGAGAVVPSDLDPAACWPGFLNELLRREPFFHAPLQQGGLQEIRGAEKPPVLVVGINNLFEQDLLKKNSRRLSEIWQECYGTAVRFETVRRPETDGGQVSTPPPGLRETAPETAKPPRPEPPKAPRSAPPGAPAPRELSAAATSGASLSPDEEAMVRRIQGIMGGEVLDIFKE